MSDIEVQLPFDLPMLPVERLRAGDISCWYERGNIRYLIAGGEEVVRMIYPAVRNSSWATANYEIEEEKRNIGEDFFEISYTAIYFLDELHYRARITITGKQDSSIVFAMDGESLSTFKSNRIGLCVLHPVTTCKGKNILVTRTDSSVYNAVFPEQVSPHQPVKGIREMTWNTDAGDSIRLKFDGEVFEMEDQRNWSDNSYKTYGPPLNKPAPVSITEGDMMYQQVEFTFSKYSAAISQVDRTKAGHKEEKIAIPKIGYSRITGTALLTTIEIDALKKLPFDHYRIELFMQSSDWQDELLTAISEAVKIGTRLELVVFFTPAFEVETTELLTFLPEHKDLIHSLLPIQVSNNVTTPPLLSYLYPRFKEVIPGIRIGYGTNGAFAELNRNRPPEADYDFVCFSLNPQVHAADLRTIAENLESQQQLITASRQFTSKPIHVSPLTFHHRKVTMTDRRLHTHFGAAWTLLTLRNLHNASSLTFYQTTGDMGLINYSGTELIHQSKIYDILIQIKRFDAVYVIIDGKPEHIIFVNPSGEKLKFIIDEHFFPYPSP
ncbi:hypothetical protein ACX0G7_01550 [Flavitalea antarctica]